MASVRLSEDVEARLNALAVTTGRSKTFYIKKLIEDNIDDLEDLYLAIHRLEHPADTMTSQAVRRELALDD